MYHNSQKCTTFLHKILYLLMSHLNHLYQMSHLNHLYQMFHLNQRFLMPQLKSSIHQCNHQMDHNQVVHMKYNTKFHHHELQHLQCYKFDHQTTHLKSSIMHSLQMYHLYHLYHYNLGHKKQLLHMKHFLLLIQ